MLACSAATRRWLAVAVVVLSALVVSGRAGAALDPGAASIVGCIGTSQSAVYYATAGAVDFTAVGECLYITSLGGSVPGFYTWDVLTVADCGAFGVTLTDDASAVDCANADLTLSTTWTPPADGFVAPFTDVVTGANTFYVVASRPGYGILPDAISYGVTGDSLSSWSLDVATAGVGGDTQHQDMWVLIGVLVCVAIAPGFWRVLLI